MVCNQVHSTERKTVPVKSSAESRSTDTRRTARAGMAYNSSKTTKKSPGECRSFCPYRRARLETNTAHLAYPWDEGLLTPI